MQSITRLYSLARPSDLGKRIETAFQGEGKQWRTVRGIAREIRTSPARVNTYIKLHSSVFKKAEVTIGGIALYSLISLTGKAANQATVKSVVRYTQPTKYTV